MMEKYVKATLSVQDQLSPENTGIVPLAVRIGHFQN